MKRELARCVLLLNLLVPIPPVSHSVAAAPPSKESVTRGKVLFTKRACANCHALDGKTVSIGPNFGDFKEKLSRSKALENILNPSKEIKKGYASTVVVTRAGKVITGRIIGDTGQDVTLLVSAAGKITTHKFKRAKVEEFLTVKTSIMPTDLLRGLKTADTDDLLNYLVSIKVIDPDKPNTDVDLQPGHAHHGALTPPYTGPDKRPRFDEVDHEITINVIPKKMQYTVELFDVRPGSRVKLTLINRDEMQHNLFLCAEGKTTWLEVARAAWALGPDGPRKRYVSDSDKVLQQTRLVNPNSRDTIYFIAPSTEGVYPYVCTIPGHAFLMRGEMHVLSGRRGLSDLTYRYYEGSWHKLPEFDKLTPQKSGPLKAALPGIKKIRKVNDHFGFVFDATLHVAVDGKYQFYLVSDDGSRIVIDGRTVVDYDGEHPDSEQKTGSVELARGAHKFQLQFFEAGGGEVLFAGWSGPGFKVLPLTSAKGTLARLRDPMTYRMLVEGTPRVMRLNMPDASSRAIAVGLIGGMNYCFDAATCHVRYGWTGEFLDVGPDRGHGRGRGGGECRPLGPRFSIAGPEFPLSIGTAAPQPPPRFAGYRRSILGPTFLYTLGKTRVEQFVEASRSGRGLTMEFTLNPTPDVPVSFQVAVDGLVHTSSAGKWNGRTLTIPAGTADAFSITLEPKP